MSTVIDTERPAPAPTTPFVTGVGLLCALWCVCFAGISIWLEVTGHFADGPHAAEAAALSVANWYVAAVKVLGVVVALLAVRRPHTVVMARVVGTLLWAAFATLGLYALGSIAQAVVLLMNGGAGLDAASVAYVSAFLAAATGFGVLAVSYTRRNGLGRSVIVLGVLGAPVMLGSILVALPALLRAVGLLQSA